MSLRTPPPPNIASKHCFLLGSSARLARKVLPVRRLELNAFRLVHVLGAVLRRRHVSNIGLDATAVDSDICLLDSSSRGTNIDRILSVSRFYLTLLARYLKFSPGMHDVKTDLDAG